MISSLGSCARILTICAGHGRAHTRVDPGQLRAIILRFNRLRISILVLF